MLKARIFRVRWRVSVVLVAFVLIVGLAVGVKQPTTAQTQRRPTATAFVVHSDGYLLTAAHAVKDAANVEVAIGGKSYNAFVLGVDKKRDLAVLQIKAKNLPILPLGNSNTVEVGEEVRVFGFPLASALGESLKVTRGIVSGIQTKGAQKVFQIDAAVNPGNSGGPLVNEEGEVIGVINAKLFGAVVSNVGFAVPINYAKPLLRDEAVDLATRGAKDRLRGPTLFKRVSPAVARVVIHFALYDLVRTIKTFSSVNQVAFSPGAYVIATALDKGKPPHSYDDSSVKLWDYQSGSLIMTMEQEGRVVSIAFSPDGKMIVTGAEAGNLSKPGQMTLWDVRSGKPKWTRKEHVGGIKSVAFSPDGKLVASGGFDDAVKIWHARSGALLQTLTGHTNSVYSVAYSPGGETLASGGWDKTVILWDVQTRRLRRKLTGHTYGVESVAFSPDRRTLASGSGDNTVRLWDTQSGALKRTLIGHTETVLWVVFSPDGKTVASAGYDKKVRLWDVRSGARKGIITVGRSSSADSVGFSPDGKKLAAGVGWTVKIWEAEQ
ncbi:MAG: trypsin-like peptidase domain-containing protein [Nitrospinota bacterium]